MIMKRFAAQMKIFICLLCIISPLYGKMQLPTWTPTVQSITQAITETPKHLVSLLPTTVVDIEDQKPSIDENELIANESDGTPRKISWREWFSKIGPQLKAHIKEQSVFYLIFALFGAGLICVPDPTEFFDAIKQISGSSLLQSLALQYIRYGILCAVHEGGHALTNYLINNASTDIYWGALEPSDGVELFPHFILASAQLSIGASAGMKNPMQKPYKQRLEALSLLIKEFSNLYPKMTLKQLEALPDFQKRFAAIEAYDKSLVNQIKYTITRAAGVVSALIANGVIKYVAGEPLLSVDYYDIKQLLNFMPMQNSDGGQIINKVFDRPDITQAGEHWYVQVALAAFFLKACAENGCIENISTASLRETAKKIFQAGGFATLNFAGMGVANIPATSIASAA